MYFAFVRIVFVLNGRRVVAFAGGSAENDYRNVGKLFRFVEQLVGIPRLIVDARLEQSARLVVVSVERVVPERSAALERLVHGYELFVVLDAVVGQRFEKIDVRRKALRRIYRASRTRAAHYPLRRRPAEYVYLAVLVLVERQGLVVVLGHDDALLLDLRGKILAELAFGGAELFRAQPQCDHIRENSARNGYRDYEHDEKSGYRKAHDSESFGFHTFFVFLLPFDIRARHDPRP